jgi:hypothetical protein
MLSESSKMVREKFVCELCHYSGNRKSQYDRHLQTQKHIDNIQSSKSSKSSKKVQKKFVCELCDYYGIRKSQYDRHLQTQKHIDNIQSSKGSKGSDGILYCHCGKQYKHTSSFSRHKKTCEIYKNKSIIPVNENVQTNDIIKSSDLQNIIQSITTSKGKDGDTTIINININNTYENIQTKAEKVNNNNNNTFNVMNYLNTECKDAYNLEDYAKNYAVTFKHLDDLHNKGCVKAYTDNFISDIKKLPHNKRPIHCTDAKRKSFQVKNKGVWVRDVGPDNEIIVDSLKTITNNQCDTLKQWKNLNKDWLDDERKQEFANKTTRNIVDIYTDTIQKKIINNLTCLNPNPTKPLSL